MHKNLALLFVVSVPSILQAQFNADRYYHEVCSHYWELMRNDSSPFGTSYASAYWQWSLPFAGEVRLPHPADDPSCRGSMPSGLGNRFGQNSPKYANPPVPSLPSFRRPPYGNGFSGGGGTGPDENQVNSYLLDQIKKLVEDDSAWIKTFLMDEAVRKLTVQQQIENRRAAIETLKKLESSTAKNDKK